MYFRKYGVRKTWLAKCLRKPISGDPSTSSMVNVPNSAEINTTAHLL